MRPSVISSSNRTPSYNTEVNVPYPTILLAELENNSLSVEESEKKISQMIHDFYHPKA